MHTHNTITIIVDLDRLPPGALLGGRACKILRIIIAALK